MLFFYFSPLDLGQHMFWVLNDPTHPFYNEEQSKKYGYIRDEFYREHDRILGQALKKLPSELPIMVISDHGFNPFKRKVNINNWLIQENYLHMQGGSQEGGLSIIDQAVWSQTKAYAIGFNSIYLNLMGRETEGIVLPEERRKLLDEMKGKLEGIIDPATGQKVVSNAYISEDHFSKDYLDRAPDIIIGFNRGYRAGDSTALGTLSKSFLADNLNWWSGDHFVDPLHVPATFLSNFKINQEIPNIKDLAPTILNLFGISTPKTMNGKSLT